MQSLDKIAKAYGQDIINAVKTQSCSMDALQLSESSESPCNFSKRASALLASASDSSYAVLPYNNHELKGFDKTSLKIGTHPDFLSLEQGGDEFHYAINVFVDIKGSTSLAMKMTLREVKNFKDKVITTAIQIFQALGGHIQRIQGDAIYAVFCWKGIKKSDSIIAALNATSLLNYIIDANNDSFIKEFGTSLAIRTGIDFGDDTEVLWSKYGIPGCSEVTTTSLHTDLACKMQQQASDNEIIIGKNIQELLDLPPEFSTEIRSDAFSEYNYITFAFNWKTYLGRFPANPQKSAKMDGHIAKNISVSCQYQDDNAHGYVPYIANTKALPKGVKLRFELHGFTFNKYDRIIWKVKNRGQEASKDEPLSFNMPSFENKITCLQDTAYKGHHYMICEIYSNGRKVAEEYFGIFVNNN